MSSILIYIYTKYILPSVNALHSTVAIRQAIFHYFIVCSNFVQEIITITLQFRAIHTALS